MNRKGDDLTFWEIQFLLAIFAFNGLDWGGATWLIQLKTGGPAWLPLAVGLGVYIATLVIVILNRVFGHRH